MEKVKVLFIEGRMAVLQNGDNMPIEFTLDKDEVALINRIVLNSAKIRTIEELTKRGLMKDGELTKEDSDG